jgi:hypothetical protein
MAVDITQLASGRPALGDADYKLADTFDLNGQATGNVLYCFEVPKGHRVKNVTCTIVTAMGLTATAEVGIYSDKAGSEVADENFDASADLNATAGTMTTGAGGTDAYVTAGGYLNLTPAVTYVCLTLTIAAGPATAGKVRVVALMTDET